MIDEYEGLPKPGTRVRVRWLGKYPVEGVVAAIDHVCGVPHALVLVKLEGLLEADRPFHQLCARDEMELIPAEHEIVKAL